MNIKLIGRKKELEALREYISSNRSEFVAVYGRRRVGKTFLIRQMTADNFAFYVTGMDNANMKEQLTNFSIALQRHKKSTTLSVSENWILAFYELARYLETLPDGPKVIFIDELPLIIFLLCGKIAVWRRILTGCFLKVEQSCPMNLKTSIVPCSRNDGVTLLFCQEQIYIRLTDWRLKLPVFAFG